MSEVKKSAICLTPITHHPLRADSIIQSPNFEPPQNPKTKYHLGRERERERGIHTAAFALFP